MPQPIGKRAVSVAVVRPSVAYVANNREPKGLACPNLKGRFSTLDAARIPVSRSKGQRSGSPGPCWHISCAISSECQGLRTSNLVYGWRTTTRISHIRHDLQGQWSRSQGHVISLSRVGPMARKSKTNSRIISKIGRRVSHDTYYMAHQFQGQKVKGQVTSRLPQTHKMCHVLRTVRPKNFKVGVRMEDVDPHQR